MLIKSLLLDASSLIDNLTRLTKTSSIIIDYFYTNELLTSMDSKIVLVT